MICTWVDFTQLFGHGLICIFQPPCGWKKVGRKRWVKGKVVLTRCICTNVILIGATSVVCPHMLYAEMLPYCSDFIKQLLKSLSCNGCAAPSPCKLIFNRFLHTCVCLCVCVCVCVCVRVSKENNFSESLAPKIKFEF